MRIIDTRKDFYDYLAGIYGIDNLAVYDRRGSVPAAKILSDYPEIFSRGFVGRTAFYQGDDIPDNWGRFTRKDFGRPFMCRYYYIMVEAGVEHFFITAERMKKKSDSPLSLKYTIETSGELAKKVSSIKWWHPLRQYAEIMKKHAAAGDRKLIPSPLGLSISRGYSWKGKPEIIQNPILDGTPLAGILDPDKIYIGIHNWLLSEREPKIVDTRTDVEHLESAGFDRKTSFRNVK